MEIRLTKKDKRISRIKIYLVISILISFGFGILFDKYIHLFETIFIILLTIQLISFILLFLFFKDYIISGTLTLQTTGVLIKSKNEEEKIAIDNISAIVIHLVGEAGKGWALFGGEGSLNKIEIYNQNLKRTFTFYLENKKEIDTLKNNLEIIKTDNSDLKIKIVD